MNKREPDMTSQTRIAILAITLAAACGTAIAQNYAITDLGVLSPYVVSEARAINASNQITGTLHDAADTQTQAFLYSGGTLAALGSMTGTYAYALNDSGIVVGEMAVGFAQSHAFAYTTAYIDLGTFGGLNSYALGINNNTIICGAALTGDGQTHAFTYSGGIMYDIHILAQASELSNPVPTGDIIYSTYSEARDINDSNDVVGYFTAPDSTGSVTDRAFHYRNEILTELGSLGRTNSRATAINAGGRIVGWSELPSGQKRAAIFYTNGNILNLGTPSAAATWSAAYALNDSGIIVGAAGTSATDTVAFIYNNASTTDLNTLIPAASGWYLQAATGINNAGRITGYGLVNGETHAFLLTPVTSSSSGSSSGSTTPGLSGLCGTGTGIPLAFACLCLLAVNFRRRHS